MTIKFEKKINESTFLDPGNNFQPKTIKIEIRFDPLTGQISRIFPLRQLILHRHDWTPYVEESKQKFCPFCPAVLEKVTPKFPEDIAPEGRIKVGDAVTVPNINPYEKYASVVVMSSRHYIPMEEIETTLMVDSFQAGLEYLRRAAAVDPAGASYASINWNYMPYAGGSLIHPHLQVLAGSQPSTYDNRLIKASVNYFKQHKSNYWEDLVDKEINNGKRYIGKTGNAHWLSVFAPRHVGDVIGIILGKQTIDDLSGQDLADFASGFKKVIDYYNRCNIVSFNAALYFAHREDIGFTVHARIVGRFTIFPLVGSDITHMQILHDDPWTVVLPEIIAGDLKNDF
jgi:galactose-1-phosphate uridylyltransferase